jgi:hypothetical protein
VRGGPLVAIHEVRQKHILEAVILE